MTNSKCELCSSQTDLTTFEVPLTTGASFNNTAILCDVCRKQIEEQGPISVHHWHSLHESIWTENPAVKVLAWRILKKLSGESWAQDLLDQMYLEDDLLEWAKNEGGSDADPVSQTRDSNGTVLNNEDAVILIKDLEVKGAGFTAKRGTVVKKISLTDDPGLVEGRINGIQIVLKTCFLKKS